MHKLLSFHYVYLLPIALSAIFSLRSFGLKWPRAYRAFSVFLILTLVAEVLAISWKWYLYQTSYWSYSRSNLWIYNAMHLLRSTWLILFYYGIMDKIFVKRMVLYIGGFIILLGLIEFFFLTGPHQMNSYTLILTNVLFVFLSLEFFRETLGKKEIVRLSVHPGAWISLGVFIYNSASLPYFIYFNYMKQYPGPATAMIYLSDLLNIVTYTFYLIAFLCKPHSPR